MKQLITLVFLCLLSISTTRAQQPSAPASDADQPATAADIDRYFEVMHIRDTMKRMATTVSQQVRKTFKSEEGDASSDPPEVEKKLDDISDRLIAEMPIDDMLDAMRPVYMKHFTHGDIDAIVAFYSGPTGQKFLAETPAISKEGMEAASPVIQKYQAHVHQVIRDQMAEMQKQAKQKSTITN